MPNRSFHFIPAHRPSLLEKASSLAADHIVYDLEDGVPTGDKKTARHHLHEHLACGSHSQTWVRCNPTKSKAFADDISLLQKFPTAGIVLPKFEEANLIDRINAIDTMQKRRFIVIIETFAAVEMLPILAMHKSVFAIAVGLEDLLSEFVVPNDRLTEIAQHVRLRALVAAKAYGRVCIDGISTEYMDVNRLNCECEQSRNLGFDGKFTIHPKQISVVNKLYSVSDESRIWAEQVLDKSNQETGVGYTIKDGELITPPKVAKAKRIADAIEESNDQR